MTGATRPVGMQHISLQALSGACLGLYALQPVTLGMPDNDVKSPIKLEE